VLPDPWPHSGQILPWLVSAYRELTVFSAFWLLVGLIDDLLVDFLWLMLVLRGRVQARCLPRGFEQRELSAPMAVFIPAWCEAQVIGTTVRHALDAWPQRKVRIYVGCYANDPDTARAVLAAGHGDPRLCAVPIGVAGPSTKADCLNRLYRALERDEAAAGRSVQAVVLHDAEDMVHPAELVLFEQVLASVDFVQLPVRAEPLAGSPWVAGHYIDEFAEAHTKTMVVRDALGGALPAAGVGCAIARSVLARLDQQRQTDGGGSSGPFAPECLTEDYEIGWRIARMGGRSRFVRVRDAGGALVATRAHFPAHFACAVRQKTRWTHGIAYQGWDRLGWSGTLVDRWMALRDRRAPMAALVLLAAYASLVTGLILAAVGPPAGIAALAPTPWTDLFLLASGAGLVWRLVCRFLFSTHERGLVEGLRSLARAPLSNVIAIASAHRALRAYLGSLRGTPTVWDKTRHDSHPAAPPSHR